MVLRLGIRYPSGFREELALNEGLIHALEILHTRIQQPTVACSHEIKVYIKCENTAKYLIQINVKYSYLEVWLYTKMLYWREIKTLAHPRHCRDSPVVKSRYLSPNDWCIRHKSAVAQGTCGTGSPELWLFVYAIRAIFCVVPQLLYEKSRVIS